MYRTGRQERFMASIRESTRTQKDWEFEGRFIKPTGEEKYIRGVSRARRLGDETVHDGIVLDTTEHRRADRRCGIVKNCTVSYSR